MPHVKEYLVNLMGNVAELDYLCDVTLVAGSDGQKFPVHRVIMVGSSPYFKALLGPNYIEANQKEIVLKEIDGRTLKTIIGYCYSGYVRITNENADDIMAAASSMELLQLEARCTSFWHQQLDVGNSVNILLVAAKYNLQHLWKQALRTICDNFEKIPHADLVQIDHENFKAILHEDKINAAENNVFYCFAKWIQHDEANRSRFVTDLANLIRLKHVSSECLSEFVESFYEKHGCMKLVVDEYRKRVCHPKALKAHRMVGKIKLFCVELNVFKQPGQYFMMVWDDIAREFTCRKCIKNPIQTALLWNYPFFVFHRDTIGDKKMKVEVLSVALGNEFHEVWADLQFASICDSLIPISRYIYAFGMNRETPDEEFLFFNSCLRLDMEKKAWEMMKPLPYRMSQLSAVELNGLIYVSGNIDPSEEYSSNFWCYDPNRNLWTEKSHTNLDERDIVLCKTKQSIFICNHHVGLLKYDVALNRWSKVGVVLPERVKWDYVLRAVVDYGDKTYGFITMRTGHLFVSFNSIESDWLPVEIHDNQYLGSSDKIHLFVN